MNTRPQSRPEAELPETDGAVAFRFRDRELGGEWSKWLPIEELNHYANGSLVDGPHPDWDVERAYGQQCAATRPAEVGGVERAVQEILSRHQRAAEAANFKGCGCADCVTLRLGSTGE